MSEVMISRRGGGSGSCGNSLRTEYLFFNHNWVVPSNVKENKFSVRLIGAGGGSPETSFYWGGGSGWVNNADLILNPGENIRISIANGVPNYANGGTTSFGTYLSANGGSSDGSGGAGGGGKVTVNNGGRGYQFGGGMTYYVGGGSYVAANNVSAGGAYGGGGFCQLNGNTNSQNISSGGIYGGGGFVSRCWTANSNCYNMGRGGTYGGSGAISFNYAQAGAVYKLAVSNSSYNGGRGGFTYSLSGNYIIISGTLKNGINTIGWSNVFKDEYDGNYLTGNGMSCKPFLYGELEGYVNPGTYNLANAQTAHSGAGGGYGGSAYIGNTSYGAGGGGGYGSNGGVGGGGGYGGDGGNGGGGGYGKISKGGNYSGGGYYCPGGGINNRAGGGGMGMIKDNKLIASFGSGGGWESSSESGIVVVQYYI